MDASVVARDVTKVYDGTRALDGVSLSVHPGEVLALVGPNGAGKTTLVRVLTGTVEATSGEARLLGVPPTEVDRSRIGVLPQAFSPPRRLSVRELFDYYAGLYDDPRDPATALAEVGLEDAADDWYETLSGGQQRRVCLGAALINEPEVLLLDEPTTGIDPAGRRTVRRHITDLTADGTTVLVTTHDMDEAERIADRVALLADGRLRAVDSPGALVREHGGPPRVVVETSTSTDGKRATDSLVDAGYDPRVTDEGLSVPDVPAARIGDLVSVLEDVGVDYEGLAWRQPGLEDAYIALAGDQETGGAKREEPPTGVATGERL